MKKTFWIIYWSITVTLLIAVLVISRTSGISEEDFLPWLVVGLIMGAFAIGRIFSFFEKKPYDRYRDIRGNPDDDSSGTSGDSSGTSGEGSEWYEDRYKKNWRGKK